MITSQLKSTKDLIDRAKVQALVDRETDRLNEYSGHSSVMYERAKVLDGQRRAFVVSDARPVADLHVPEGRLKVRGCRWRTSASISTTGSARWSRVTPTQRSSKPSRSAANSGTHFAAPLRTTWSSAMSWPTLRLSRVALRQLRFGSDDGRDPIARGLTGNDTIIKIFGSYHGHHDYVMVSIGVPYDKIGDRENYLSLPYGAGIPKSVAEMTIAVPFNDAGAMERRIERLIAEGRKPACLIMEAALMNLGVVLPNRGTSKRSGRSRGNTASSGSWMRSRPSGRGGRRGY